MTQDKSFVKQAFLDHLRRQGFSPDHLAAYAEYFDFFLSCFGPEKMMDLDPEALYTQAVQGVEQLDGEDVIDAYLELIELFIEYWTERWEKMQP